jgi:predicted enzyme related to lactoylglutathione lyase
MTDAAIRGRVIWHELMARDTQAAAAFYTRVVGWAQGVDPQGTSFAVHSLRAGA